MKLGSFTKASVLDSVMPLAVDSLMVVLDLRISEPKRVASACEIKCIDAPVSPIGSSEQRAKTAEP